MTNSRVLLLVGLVLAFSSCPAGAQEAEPPPFDRAVVFVDAAPSAEDPFPRPSTAFVVRSEAKADRFYLVLPNIDPAAERTGKVGLPLDRSRTLWGDLTDLVEPVDGQILQRHPTDSIAVSRLKRGDSELSRGLEKIAVRMDQLKPVPPPGSKVQMVGFPALLEPKAGERAIRAVYTCFVATEEFRPLKPRLPSPTILLRPAASSGARGAPVFHQPDYEAPVECVGMCRSGVGDNQVSAIFSTMIPAHEIEAFIRGIDREKRQ